MEAEDWRSLVDLGRLVEWMDGRGLESGPIAEVTPLSGGTQNILLRFRRGDRRFVLRRPPAHPLLDGTQTMRREARVLAALADTRVPHPRLIAACDDKAVLGAGFYLMQPVEGFSPNVGLPPNYAENADWRRRMGLAMADGAADLATVDYLAAGLADFGKLDNYLERQIERWRGQLESYHDYAGWPGPSALPGVGEVYAWLTANRPAHFQPGIVHGDYSPGNIMFCYDRPEIAALVDWELATLGDPLIDLGWLLAMWPDPDGTGPNPKVLITPWQGFPTAAELVARYGEKSGRDMSSWPWFAVLAAYKLAVILEGSYARAMAGKSPMDIGESFHASTIRLFSRALETIARVG